MDPRQPQHPFARNTASPYGRTPFPPSSASHAPPAAPSYAEHQRRPSDPPFYNAPRTYGQEAPPMAGQGHQRHLSSSSGGHGNPASRNMPPPPSSPPPLHQQQQQQQAASGPPHHNYGPLRARGGPAVPPGLAGPPPPTFGTRELPSLAQLNPTTRPGSTGGSGSGSSSSMSILSMLGGPQPAREAAPSHYTSPGPAAAPAPAAKPGFTGFTSPRTRAAGPEYAPFRRPHTPEHPRLYEPRDHGANSAGSPISISMNQNQNQNQSQSQSQNQLYPTPEARRYGTPHQGYGPSAPPERPPLDERRETLAHGPNAAPPPRPSSQPAVYSAQGPPRVGEDPRPMHTDGPFGRRADKGARASEPRGRESLYARPQFEERHPAYAFAERERQDREATIQRERERVERERIVERERMDRERDRERERDLARLREREQRDRAEHENLQREYAHQVAQRSAQQAAYNNRPAEPAREQHAWSRPNHEPPPPAARQQEYDPAGPPERPRYEYPGTTAPPYNPGPPPAYAPSEPRYGPTAASSLQSNPPPTSQYEASVSLQERLRVAQAQQQAQLAAQQQQAQPYAGPPPTNPPYQPHESPQRRPPVDDPQQLQQQRNLLSVQEFNRRGRASPLPQAVQGVQGQLNGPGSEPNIKNEFGKMFSGIGSGVGVPSPVSAAGSQGAPYAAAGGQLRREDAEAPQESPTENGGHKLARSASRGGRRRKLNDVLMKEQDVKGDDDSSTGRRTPSGRGKRAKTAHHHHHHHHHHHRIDQLDKGSPPPPPSLTPFKSSKGQVIPSPTGLDGKTTSTQHHHVSRQGQGQGHHHHHHHHHHHVPAKPPNLIPIPKTTIHNQAVLDSVAHLPRKNLGHGYYKSTLSPGIGSARRDHSSTRGFASTPNAIPKFEGCENSIYTIKVPRIHLDHISREEITRRRAVWGTDIYTDDSDVIAACIHQGWFRGAWSDDVDTKYLGLEIDVPNPTGEVRKPADSLEPLTRPPATGPMEVPKNRDCHITVLILPALEHYGSITRFGIKSREWGFTREGYRSVHDGLSYMIMGVKWVKGVDGEGARSGSGRSKIFAEQLDAQELWDEEAEDAYLMQGLGATTAGSFEESYVRGGGLKGIGTHSWWREPPGKGTAREGGDEAESAPTTSRGSGPPAEPDAVDTQKAIERITERMVVNANTAITAPAAADDDDDVAVETRRKNEKESTAAAILAFGLDGKGARRGPNT